MGEIIANCKPITANGIRIFVPLSANCPLAIANSTKMGSTGIDRMEISK
jgi:hypothetical protein